MKEIKRDEGSGPFHPGYRRGTGHRSQYGAEIPEDAGGHAAEAPAFQGIEPFDKAQEDAYAEYVDRRVSEGLGELCVVLHRGLRALDYDGGYSILDSCVSAAPASSASGCHDAFRDQLPGGRPNGSTAGPRMGPVAEAAGLFRGAGMAA